MLRNPKKPVLIQAQPSPVDLFVEHYDELKRWAFQFTDGDQAAAEDLLHDAFINFTMNKPDIGSIQNINGYLYIVMRNLHLSQIRRTTRMPVRSISVVEYDSAEMSYWASDPRDQWKLTDELGAVCHFACHRKESAKSGSLLILRFFHGYYPDEIATFMQTNRATINAWLNKVRAEVRMFLEEPERLVLLEGRKLPEFERIGKYSPDRDLRLDLRQQIFNSRQGDCIAPERLNTVYASTDGTVLDRQSLAHIVSCPACIETVNTLLELPSLASRYPVDTLGNDPGKKGGFRGGGGAGGGGSMLDSYINRRKEHFYHEPRELCISVNGQFHGMQRIVSGKGELVLPIDTNESVGFVEVFSEMGVRLLMLHVEAPPEGKGKQSSYTELSFGRRLDANLSFGGQFPTLQVTYNDPMLEESEASNLAETAEAVSATSGDEILSEASGKGAAKWSHRLIDGFKFWLQPARLTSAFAALLVVSILLYQFAPTTVSAAELLNRSSEQEIAQLANKERVLHRTLDLEEYRGGQLASRRKIDVWHSAERGVTARRLYDEQGSLITGDWRSASGIQTIYNRGEAARLQPVPEKRGGDVLFEDVWQLSLSAREFNTLVRKADDVSYEERATDYLITYEPKADPDALVMKEFPERTLVRAAITLSKEDLHAIEQTFTLRVGEETREYRMVETAYEWRPANSVAPAVFEPNVELTGETVRRSEPGAVSTGLPAVDIATTNSNTNASVTTAPAAIATAALEVEVIEALNNANAFMGEQINVNRTADGKIVVTAMVETAQRKQAILAALSTVRNNPAVRLQVETVAEVQARIARQKGSASGKPGTVQQIEIREDQNPVLNELRKKLSEEEARNFANRVMGRSRQARLHALAAKQLAERFSAADLQSLTPAERQRWIALVRGHAEKFLGELESLRRELGPYFPEAAGASSGGGKISGDGELQTRVRDLFQFASTLKAGLDRSFSSNSDAGGQPPVMTVGFWRTFAQATGTARSIAAVQ